MTAKESDKVLGGSASWRENSVQKVTGSGMTAGSPPVTGERSGVCLRRGLPEGGGDPLLSLRR